MTALPWLTARPIAHRGLHDAASGIIENSLSAADAAIAGGFAIECDVQDTGDGEAVVFHDFSLDRLTGEGGLVRQRPLAELETMTLSGSEDRIPSLGTFLDRIGGRVPLVIEVKSRFDGDLNLVRRTADQVRSYAGPVAVKSFDPAIVAAMRELAPEVPRGIVAQARFDHPDWSALDPDQKHEFGNLLHLERSRPDFLSWRVADLPCAAPYLARVLGKIPVMAWTVRTQEDRRRAADHADQIVFEGFRP